MEKSLHESVEACRHIRQIKLPHYLNTAPRKLKANGLNIIIKQVDENLGLYILDRDWYLNEGH
jgi:hypothetical protein